MLPSSEGELAGKKPWSTPVVEEVSVESLPAELRMLALGLPDAGLPPQGVAKQIAAAANGGDTQVEKFLVSTADAARYGVVYRRLREERGEPAAKNEMSWELSTVAMVPPNKLPRELERIQRLAGLQ